MNPNLYSYLEKFNDFILKIMDLKKEDILKVSDYDLL
jgi:hypothetical protein